MEYIRMLRLCLSIVMIIALLYLIFKDIGRCDDELNIVRHHNNQIIFNKLQHEYAKQNEEELNKLLEIYKLNDYSGYFRDTVEQQYAQNECNNCGVYSEKNSDL